MFSRVAREVIAPKLLWFLRLSAWLYVAWSLSRLVGVAAYLHIGGEPIAAEAWAWVTCLSVIPVLWVVVSKALHSGKPWARIAASALGLASFIELPVGAAVALLAFLYLAISWQHATSAA